MSGFLTRDQVEPIAKPIRAPKSRTMVVLRCVGCGTLVRRRSDYRPKTADGLVRCQSCAKRHGSTGRTYPERMTGRQVDCAECGRSFYRKASALGGSKLYCSNACKGKALRGRARPENVGVSRNAGAKNGQYRHGERTGINTISRKRVRVEVAERDGDWCLLCGASPPGLHLHRVWYGSQGGKYVTANCVQLCNSHHRTVHNWKRVWQHELLAYIETPTESVRLHLRAILAARAAS